MKRLSHRSYTETALLALALGMSVPTTGANAQSSSGNDANNMVLEEIVVTAQFRSQNLQDTPIAITALNSEMMEARGQTNVTDISASAPNVTIQPANAGFGNAAAIFIRGVGQFDYNFALEPGVGVYVDDVYYPTIFGSALDLLDLDRVEILRGPQGTLAGKNSIGGAIKLYSKKPSGERDGFVEATYGRFDRIELRAASNVTLVEDALFARVSGALKHSDGYLTRYDFSCRNPDSGFPSQRLTEDCELGTEGGQDYQGIRTAIRWIAGDRLEVNLIGDYGVDNPEPSPSQLLQATSPYAQQFITDEKFVNYATYSIPTSGYAVEPLSRAKSRGVSATIDYQLTDTMQLTSISAYRKTNGVFSSDLDVSPQGGSLLYNTEKFGTFTQEVRLNGSFGALVDYTLGGYYYRGRGFLGGRNDVGFDVAPDTRVTTVNFVQADDIDSSSKSAFLHTVFHITDRLNASAGVRYTDEKKTYDFRRIDPATGGLPPLVGGLDGVSADPPYTDSRWDYRFNVDYRWSPEILTYATISTGFKGGGINPRPYTPAQAVPFQPEELTAYEIGAKTDFFDRRLRINLSAFFNDYKNIQITTTGPFADFPISARPENAGAAHVKGLELETTVYPVDGLMIDGMVSYLDFDYQSLTASAVASGFTLDMVNPYTPEWNASVGVQYDMASSAGTITPRLDVNYQSSAYTLGQNAASNLLDGYTLLNGRITFTPRDSDWRLAVSVTNLTDKYYYINKFDILSQPSSVVFGTVARPREWSVSLKRSF